jgi:tetratricopeptide (TPR) repeat protein
MEMETPMNPSRSYEPWVLVEPDVARYLENEARRHPDWADVQNRWGLLELSRGRVESATDIFAHALALNPGYKWACANYVQALALCGESPRARAFLHENECEDFGVKAMVHAFLEFLDGRYAEAEKALERAPESIWERPDFLRFRAACRAAAQPGSGDAVWEKAAPAFAGLDPQLVAPWDEHGNIRPRLLSFIPGMHQLWVIISTFLGRLGRWQDAEWAALASYAFFADRSMLLNQQGQLASLRGEGDAAVRLWEEAAWLAPESPNPHINLAYHWSAQGDLESAFESLSSALARAPRYADLLYQMGLLLQARGEFDRALQSFRRALDRNPYYTMARLQEAETLFTLERWDEARNSYRRVLETGLGSCDLYTKLGVCEEKLGEMAEAEAAFREAVQLNPGDSRIYDRLGSLLAHQGRVADAQNVWRRFLEMSDDTVRSAEVATLLKALQERNRTA